jgi:hypothetical protein
MPQSGIQRHMKDHHKEIPLDVRRRIVNYASELQLDRPESIWMDTVKKTKALDGFTLYDGWKCEEKVDDEGVCTKVFVSEEWMRKHCTEEHGWKKSRGRSWSQQRVQTLFSGSLRRYFPVTVDGDDSLSYTDALDIGQIIETTIARKQADESSARNAQNTIEECSSDIAHSPWLRRTDWLNQFQGKDMISLVGLTTTEGTISNDEFVIIKESVLRVIMKCLDGARDCDRRGWQQIRFWLHSHDKSRAHEKPFRKDYQSETIARYVGWWSRLIWFCRSASENTFDTGLRLLQSQRQSLDMIGRILEFRPDDSSQILDGCILKFSASLIQHSDYEAIISPIKHFAGVMGYDATKGKWKHPVNYTPFLAGIQACIRLIGLEIALPTESRDTMEQPFEDFRKFRDRWLVDDEGNPFSFIHKLLQYGLAVSRDWNAEDKIRFSADRDRCFYEGTGFQVKALKCFVDDILRRAEEVLSRQLQFRRQDTIESIDLYSIKDHHFITDTNYSFADLIPDHKAKARGTLISNLQTSEKWNEFITIQVNQIIWREAGVISYKESVNEFLKLTLIAMNMTCGLTGRGTEMVSLRYQNKTSSDRNLIIEDGQVMIVTEYHKSQAIMDNVKVLFSDDDQAKTLENCKVPAMDLIETTCQLYTDRYTFS